MLPHISSLPHTPPQLLSTVHPRLPLDANAFATPFHQTAPMAPMIVAPTMADVYNRQQPAATPPYFLPVLAPGQQAQNKVQPLSAHKPAPSKGESKSDMILLSAIKIIFGAVVLGYGGSKLMGKSLGLSILIDVGLNIIESLSIDRLYRGKSKPVEAIQAFLGKHFGNVTKPISQWNDDDRRNVMAPLAGVINALSALVFPVLLKWLPEHDSPMTKEGLQHALQTASNPAKKLMPKLRLQILRLHETGMYKAYKKNPIAGMVLTAGLGLVAGWFEGATAHKLIKSDMVENLKMKFQ